MSVDNKKFAKVIAIFNQKGGVGKTTTAVNLSQIMSEVYKKKVLLVDFDAQGSATLYCNIPNWEEDIPDIGDLVQPIALNGELPTIQTIMRSIHTGKYLKNVRVKNSMNWERVEKEYDFDILPVCGTSLSIAELAIHNPENFIHKNTKLSFMMLKFVIDEIVYWTDYDYIIIDANPSLSNFAINSLMASDFLIVPTTMTVEAISGINGILKRLKELNLYIPNFDVLGILYQKYDGGRLLDQSILDETNFNAFETRIPDISTRVSKSINEGIIASMKQDKQYASFRNAYIELCKEVEDKIKFYENKNGAINRKFINKTYLIELEKGEKRALELKEIIEKRERRN